MDEKTATVPGPTEPEPSKDGADHRDRWGRFRRLSLLGKGGMGEVFEAYDPHLDRKVAVKILRENVPEAVQRFIREARAQARVKHPGICEIYEVGESKGEPFIVMRLIRGRTLADLALELNLEQKLVIMAQVASAVHEAHRSGLVHRDIKPGNILVEEAENGTLRPFVVDFGIARLHGDPGLTATGSFLGTPGYSAPEQIRGEAGTIDRRTDVYAIGATLYSILSGEPPFTGETPAVIYGVLNKDPKSLGPSGIPIDVETITFKCLEKAAGGRYQSARAVGDDLQHYLDGEPIAARPPGLVDRVRRSIRKNRAAWLTGLGAAMLLLIILGWAVFNQWQARARERLVRDLTAEVVAVESKARLSHMSPIHDIRPDRDRIRSSMERMADRIEDAGEIAAGPGSYALACGYLALGEIDRARELLESAWSMGYRSKEVSHALGVVLSLQYRRSLMEIETIADPELRRQLLETAQEEFQGPAVEYMRASLGQSPQQDSYLQALIAFHEEDFDTALKCLTKCRDRDPWIYETLVLAGDVYRQRAVEQRDAGETDAARTDFEHAIDAYDAALAVAESDPGIYAASGHVRYLMMEMEQSAGTDLMPLYEDGLRRAADAAEVLPVTEGALLLEARLHFRLAERRRLGHEDPDETFGPALDAANRAVSVAVDPSAAWKLVGRIQSGRALWFGAKGDLEAQWEALEKAVAALDRVDTGKDYVFFNALGSVHFGRADLMTRRGEDAREAYRSSMDAYQEALALHPSSKAALSNLYVSLLKLSALPGVDDRIEILEEAAAAFEDAAGKDPTNPVPLYYLGRSYLALAQGGDAFSSRLGPEADLALEAYRRGKELSPELPHFFSGIGEVLFLKAQHEWDWGRDAGTLLDEAETAYRQGLEISPSYAYLHVNLSWSLYYRWKYEVREGLDGRETLGLAAEQARRTLEIANRDSAVLCLGSVHRMLAEAAFLAGESPQTSIERSKKRFAQILERNPENPGAHRAMGRLLTIEARWLARSGKDPRPSFDEAREQIERALEIKPTAPTYLLAEVRRCLHMAQWLQTRREPIDTVETVVARGLDHVQAALAARPDWPEATAAGACLEGIGASGEAQVVAERALDRSLAANPHLEFEWRGCLGE